MRSPAVFFLAERYFADTAAKMSHCRTLTPGYTLILGARAFSSTRTCRIPIRTTEVKQKGWAWLPHLQLLPRQSYKPRPPFTAGLGCSGHQFNEHVDRSCENVEVGYD